MSHRATLVHITRTENLPSIQTDGLVPTIGPRSRQVGESTPAVYLFDSRPSAEDAAVNWLAEALGDGELCLLEINARGLLIDDQGISGASELLCLQTIDPPRIRLVTSHL